MYSTPKCKANIVSVKTRHAQTKDNPSTQKTKWESTKSRQ